jgi:hypothetical protein
MSRPKSICACVGGARQSTLTVLRTRNRVSLGRLQVAT